MKLLDQDGNSGFPALGRQILNCWTNTRESLPWEYLCLLWMSVSHFSQISLQQNCQSSGSLHVQPFGGTVRLFSRAAALFLHSAQQWEATSSASSHPAIRLLWGWELRPDANESCLQCRRPGSIPAGKISWSRNGNHPVFWPGNSMVREPGGPRSNDGKELDTTGATFTHHSG